MTPAREPVRYFSIGATILLVALPHLPEFGVPVTATQVDAITEVLTAAVLLVGGEVVRRRVTPV